MVKKDYFKFFEDGETIKLSSEETIFKLSSFKENPIVKPKELGLTWIENGEEKVGAVFNGGAEIYMNKVVLAPRCHKNYVREKFFDEKLGIERYRMDNYISEIWILQSEDFISFQRLDNVVIKGDGSEHQDFTYGIEDIRIVRFYTGEYFLVGCGKTKPPFKGNNADRIAIYTTKDFKTIEYRGMVREIDTKNTVPFPELIDGKLFMFFRFHPNIHLDYLRAGVDQLLNPTKYSDYWKEVLRNKEKNLLFKAGTLRHEREKIGAGTQPIKTKEGWLIIYHAVGEISEELCSVYSVKGKIVRGYSVCAALLDLNDPTKIIARTRNPIYIPSHPWELEGDSKYPIDIPYVVFPVGAIVQNDMLLLYCGAGDKYEVLLTCKLNSLVDYLLKYCRVNKSQ